MPPHLLQQTAKRRTENNVKMDAKSWNSDEVSRWLTLKGFTTLKQLFEEKKISGESLLNLTNESLRDDLSISALGIRKAILREIGLLKQANLQIGDQISFSFRRQSYIGRSKLVDGTPLLNESNSYEIVDRDVFKLHSEVVIMLVKELERLKAWEAEGIFRISGKKEAIVKIHSCLKNTSPNLSMYEEHDVAGALKQYLREISDPMIPMSLYSEFVSAVHSGSFLFIYSLFCIICIIRLVGNINESK